jgi:hypothetical protein
MLLPPLSHQMYIQNYRQKKKKKERFSKKETPTLGMGGRNPQLNGFCLDLKLRPLEFEERGIRQGLLIQSTFLHIDHTTHFLGCWLERKSPIRYYVVQSEKPEVK